MLAHIWVEENVELKLAMSQTDSQLERCVNLFLAPVLLKLSSAHEQVRKKVAIQQSDYADLEWRS